MTLRRHVGDHCDRLEECSAGELDQVIRWALQERVGGASPPPWMWERIRVLAERPTAWSLVRFGFSRGCRMVTAQLSRMDAVLLAWVASWMSAQNGWVEWRHDPRFTCLLDQYGFSLQLQLAF